MPSFYYLRKEKNMKPIKSYMKKALIMMSVAIMTAVTCFSPLEVFALNRGDITFSDTGYMTGAYPIENVWVNGQRAWCVEPSAQVTTSGGGYTASSFSDSLEKKLSRIAYHGWYESDKTNLDNAVTAVMIWEAIDGIPYNNDIPNYESLKAKVQKRIDNHDVRPNLTGTYNGKSITIKNNSSLTLNVGDSITLTDSNGVINEHSVYSNSAGLQVSINGNKITLTATKSSKDSGTLVLNKFNPKIDVNILYKNPDSQNIGVLGYVDPLYTQINVTVNKYGRLELTKYNADKSAVVPNTTYKITGPNDYSVTKTTNAQGKIVIEDLEPGKYTAVETKAADGYLIDVTPYNFTITSNETTKIERTNEVPTGEITLTKYNSDKSATIAQTTYHITGPNGYDVTKTTNSNGKIELTKLELGTYTFKETKAATGYLLNKDAIEVTLKYKDQNTAIIIGTAEQKNDEPTGKITIAKTNDQNNRINGATFEIKAAEKITNKAGTKTYYSKGEPVQTVTITSNGEVTSKELPLGTYEITETQAPEGYLLNTETKTVTLSYRDQETSIVYGDTSMVDKEPTATIHLKKEDKETKTAQGDATLKGATYKLVAGETIYNKAKTKKFYDKGETVATRTTDAEGNMADVTKLPLGFYQLKEVDPSTGYLLDETTYDIHCDYEDQYTEVVVRSTIAKEQVIKQAFEIIKISSAGTGEAKLLKGAEFTVKLTSEVNEKGWDRATAYDVLITDAKGYAKSIELPYGTYTVRETRVPDNVTPVPDFTVVVNKDSRDPQQWRVFNDGPFQALIKAVKVDKETEKTVLLEGTTFKIKNLDTNKYVGQWVWFPVPHYVDTFATDESGTVTTPDVLDAGTYQLEEIHAPYGYVLNETPIQFTISNNNAYQVAEDGVTPVITVTKEDVSTKGRITVTKIGEQLDSITKDEDGNIQFQYEKKGVDGAVFVVEANENIYSADNQKDLIYKKGTVVAELTTKNGYAQTKDLPLGKYLIYEKTAGNTFVLNKEKKEITLSYQDENTAVVFESTEYENKRQTVALDMIKADSETNEPLEGAVYGIYATQNVTKNDGTVLVKKGELVETVTSNEKGKLVFNVDLPINFTFEIKEIKSPKGYATNSTVYEVNTAYQGQDMETIQLKNTFKDDITKLEVSKKDLTNAEEIAGALLTVYTKGDETDVFDSWISGMDGFNEDGTIKPHMIKRLEAGKTYVLKEVIAPYGYALASEIEFTVKDTGEVQAVTMQDKMILGQLKFTKTGDVFNQVIMGATEFGATQSPVWNQSNIKDAQITIYAGTDIVIGNHTFYEEGEEIETLVSTTEGGELSSELPVGRYYYMETRTPYGFVRDNERHYFNIKNNQKDALQIVMSSLHNNRPTFDIDMTKVMEEQKVFLNKDAYKDVIFGIFAREDIKYYNGTTAIESDTMIATSGINAEGHLEQVPDLPFGNYYIKELSTNGQYVINDTEYDFLVEYKGDEVSGVTIQIGVDGIIENDLARGSVQIQKVDVDNKAKVLADTEYSISAHEDMSDVLATVKTNDKGIALFEGLELGTYYIQETKASDGYVLDSSIVTVTVSQHGEIITIERTNTQTTTEFSKQDLGGNELEGASMRLTDDEGNVVDEWTSSKTRHIIRGLVYGKTYTLHEDLAPIGYATASDITFTYSEDMSEVVMKDDTIKVSVSKQDATTGKELPGAHLQWIDKETGKTVADFVSTDKPTILEGIFESGKTYILREITAPNGYEVAEEIEFTIKDTGEIQKVVMKDQHTPVTIVNTGDNTNSMAWKVLAGSALIGMVLLVSINKKKKQRSNKR